jgi:cathepsin A (carboxypeptidase C)
VPYDDWLAASEGKATYGVDPNVTYQDCVGNVYSNFFTDIGTSYAINYTYLLTQTNLPNLKVLLYSGQNDIICNTLGTQRWVAKLDWSGVPLFLAAPRTQINATNGTAIGFYKTYGRLSFSTIYNGGHMLPWNQPESSRIMLERFITGSF